MTRFAVTVLFVATFVACSDEPALPTGGGAPALPDTLALPFLPLDAFLRPPPDSGRYNTLGAVSGWSVCPPCPRGAQCEPCPPFAVHLDAPAPGGLARVRVQLSDVPEDTSLLRRGHVYAVSVAVNTTTSALYADPAFGGDSLQHIRLLGLGFTRSARSALLPTKHP